MVATKDLEPLDVILREKMAMPTGTLADTHLPTCLSCYSVLVNNEDNVLERNVMDDEQRYGIFSLCPKCSLPVCKEEENDEKEGKSWSCSDNPIHRDFECKLFQEMKIKIDISPNSRNHPFYSVID